MSQRARLEQRSRTGASWYPSGPDRIVARMLGSMKIVLDPADFSLTPHLVMDGFWESWISVWAMANVLQTDHVLNIGANCGYYAMLFAKGNAHVVAVEPQQKLAENIALSAALNGLGGRVRVEQCVAGTVEADRSCQLYTDFHGSAHVSAGDVEHPSLAGDTITVKERPAHELMPDATCAFIDAEGYEPVIWEGLAPLRAKKQLRWVALEWAPARYSDPKGFLAQLRQYGLVSVVVGDGTERPMNDAALLKGSDWDTLVVRAR
jgi:FkbM family methyltransferase